MNLSDQHNAAPLQKGQYQTHWTSRTGKKSCPRSGGDEGRSSELNVPQMHMYGNRTGSSSTNAPVSTPNSALLVLPQPINAATKPPSLTATNFAGRKYQCKLCPQIFMHKSAMQHHSREIHRGEIKPHQCQQCLKSFSSAHQLAQHVRIHTGEKPYKCSYCDRRFKQLSHVQQHTRLHTGERPYKCHLANCGRTFTQLSILQQHLRNHDTQMERAKNRPYLCTICGKGFASEVSLITHRSKMCVFLQQRAALVGGANFQSCPVCYKICLNGEALMEHTQTTHKDLNVSGTPSLLHHMETMRMEPSHQFAAQYMLSRAAAEKREKATSVGISSAMNITSESTSSSNTSNMDYQDHVASTSTHQSIPSASCPHPLQLTEEEAQHQLTTQYVLSHATATDKTDKGPTAGMPSIPGSTINVASDSRSPSNTSSVDYQDSTASTSSHQQIIPVSCSHSLQLPGQVQYDHRSLSHETPIWPAWKTVRSMKKDGRKNKTQCSYN